MKLTNLKKAQKTEFVSPVLILRGQDEHPGCSSSRSGGNDSKLTPFSLSSHFYFVTFKIQLQV